MISSIRGDLIVNVRVSRYPETCGPSENSSRSTDSVKTGPTDSSFSSAPSSRRNERKRSVQAARSLDAASVVGR